MQLSVWQTDTILETLNEPLVMDHLVRRVLSGEPLDEWLAREDDRMDTGYMELRRAGVQFMDDLIGELRDEHYYGDGRERSFTRLVSTTDFYYHSARRARRGSCVRAGRPVLAFLVLDIVFELDGDERRFRARPWLGVENDPLLRLPYTRKYDVERAEFADVKHRRTWENLCVASDLVGVLADRVERVEIVRHAMAGKFRMPDMGDIHDELAAIGYGLGDGMSWLSGKVEFELVPLVEELDDRTGRWERKADFPAVACGLYRGALSDRGRRGPYMGPASVKRMVLCALEALDANIDRLTYPLDDDELDARDELAHELLANRDA